MKKSLCLLLLSFFWAATAVAADKFRVAWSHYTGWEPWAYAQNAGILKKWAAKHGIEIELTLINDYVESINLYTGGKFDACAMTNMDALTIPAVGGVDSTVIIVGDFSNGNDGIVLKNGASVKDLKGRSVKLVEFTVSHYMLARALEIAGELERLLPDVLAAAKVCTRHQTEAALPQGYALERRAFAQLLKNGPALEVLRAFQAQGEDLATFVPPVTA